MSFEDGRVVAFEIPRGKPIHSADCLSIQQLLYLRHDPPIGSNIVTIENTFNNGGIPKVGDRLDIFADELNGASRIALSALVTYVYDSRTEKNNLLLGVELTDAQTIAYLLAKRKGNARFELSATKKVSEFIDCEKPNGQRIQSQND